MGKEKLKIDQDLEIPDVGPTGEDITAIGPGESMRGTFGVIEKDESGNETGFWLPSTVKLPARLQEIGQQAFAGKIVGGGSQVGPGQQYGLTSIEFPETLTTIGNSAFQLAPLTEVVIPDSVTTIGDGAFAAADASAIHITSAKLPAGLKEIPSGLFSHQRLDSIVIPEGIETIGHHAFAGNFSTSIALSSTVTTIERNAFENCQVTELDIPTSVKFVGQSAFRVMNEKLHPTLTHLVFHEGLESIGSLAFAKSALDSLEIPTTLTTLDKNAFQGNGTGKVTLRTAVQEQAGATGAYEGVAANGTGHEVVYDKLANSGWEMDDFTYDEDAGAITGWTDKGFAKRPDNHALVLPDVTPGGKAITVIGEAAFRSPDDEVSYDDSKYDYNDVWVIKGGKPMPGRWLTSVVFPKDLVEIQKDAFLYNYLTEVPFKTAPNLTTIGETAFKGNRLMRLHLPEKVVNLSDGAFAANALVDLKLPNTLKVIPQGCFSMNIRLYEMTIPPSVTEIGAFAFAGARFETLEIPSTVKKIGRKAFHLHHLSKLTVPGSIKVIEEEAFEGTYKAQTLTKLNLEEGIEKICNGAFKEGLLTEVALPFSLKAIEGDPFLNNTGNKGLIEGKNHVVKLTTNNPAHLAFNVVEGVNGKLTTPDNYWVVLNTHTVKFDANGGSVNPASAVTSDKTGTLASLPTPMREGYSFLGWFTAKAGGEKVTTSTLFKADSTVYAQWEQKAQPVDPAKQVGKDGTAVGEGASAEAAEAAITSAKSDEGPAGSAFSVVRLQSVKQAKSSVTAKWAKVAGAAEYVVYGAARGQAMQEIATTGKTSLKVTKASGKKLAKGTYYKFMVVALDKDGKVISTSKAIHVTPKAGKAGNVAKVTIAAKKGKVTLKKGKSFKLKAKQVNAKGKKVKKCRKLAYESSNPGVATVSKKGVVKAKKKGACVVYAYAQNGVFAKVKVKVK